MSLICDKRNLPLSYGKAAGAQRRIKQKKNKERKKSFTINIQLKHRSVANVLGCQLQLHHFTVTRKVEVPQRGTDCGAPLELSSRNAARGGG